MLKSDLIQSMMHRINNVITKLNDNPTDTNVEEAIIVIGNTLRELIFLLNESNLFY